MSEFRFEPELARARTIPADWYRSAQLAERERDRVFGRTWQLVARQEQLHETGQYLTCSVAGEELILVRREDGRLGAYSNVCRHRAGPVAQGCGRGKSFQCGYHGWSYGLDGRLLTTPEFEGVRGFEKSDQALPAFRVETFGPFVFVNLDEQAPPLGEYLGTIPQDTRFLPLERMRHHKTHDYTLACNWKVYVDNYLEGYHIPIVHPGLFKQLDYKAYRTEIGRYHSKQHAPLRATADTLYHRNLSEGATPEALYYWVFPNLMLNIYPDNLQLNVILPQGPDRTITRFEWFVLDAERPEWPQQFAESFAFSDEVQAEDISICEAVQRGLRSRTYESGRYSVARENGVHHFHGLLAEFLG